MATPVINFTGFSTVISNANQTTGWSDGATTTETFREGGTALITAIRNDATITYTGNFNMSATDTHLRCYMNYLFPTTLDTDANGGLRLFVSSGNNTNTYYVGGSTTGTFLLLVQAMKFREEPPEIQLRGLQLQQKTQQMVMV
jgi:hypothetical protein